MKSSILIPSKVKKPIIWNTIKIATTNPILIKINNTNNISCWDKRLHMIPSVNAITNACAFGSAEIRIMSPI